MARSRSPRRCPADASLLVLDIPTTEIVWRYIPPPRPSAASGGRRFVSKRGEGKRTALERELLPGELDAGGHVAQLLVSDLPGSGPKAAVGCDMDSRRVAEDLDGIQHAVADQLGRLDEVAVDIEHAQAEGRLVGKVAELLDHLVAGTRLVGCSQLAAVVVGEADRVLAALLHPLDRREEEVVIRETEMGREHRVEALDAGVEAVEEQVQLVGLG